MSFTGVANPRRTRLIDLQADHAPEPAPQTPDTATDTAAPEVSGQG
ncbi:hypothetical protein JOD54_005184 [Actinokineospora baliensis]|nr:hypothetical protein [Actinokineospora baliensis]MBM7774980.1 hypothetical protein [Actinokineospora baliensis]